MTSWQIAEVSKQVAVVSQDLAERTKKTTQVAKEGTDATIRLDRSIRLLTVRVHALEEQMKTVHVHVP